MLDGRDDEPLAPPATTSARRKSQHIGLGPAGREHDVPRLGAHERGDLLAGPLDDPPRGAAFGMDRGRVSDDVERRQHGGARRRAQRRGRIPVEVDPFSHGRDYLLQRGGTTKPPSKLLLFVPAIVLKSPCRDHPALRARKTFLVAACQKLEWF